MIRYFLVALSVLLLAACTSSGFKAVTQTETGSFLQLSGNYQNAELVIDDQPAIVIDKNIQTFKLDGKVVAKFAVAKGSHKVKISKAGQQVVNRTVFISEGNVFEINVP